MTVTLRLWFALQGLSYAAKDAAAELRNPEWPGSKEHAVGQVELLAEALAEIAEEVRPTSSSSHSEET